MKISVIIPAYNEEKVIANTICKIRQAMDANMAPDITYEIIVCNNNSSDQTEAICKNLKVKTIFEKENVIAKTRNTGAGIAEGDWLLFIDADSYPKPKLIKECICAIKSNKYIGFGATIKADRSKFWYRFIIFITNTNLRRNKMAIGAFIGCNTEAFRAIGGFNDKLYYLEEMDFLIRLKEFGRQAGKEFIVFYKNPLVFSGRRSYRMKWREFNKLNSDGLKNPEILKDKKHWKAWYSKDHRP